MACTDSDFTLQSHYVSCVSQLLPLRCLNYFTSQRTLCITTPNHTTYSASQRCANADAMSHTRLHQQLDAHGRARVAGLLRSLVGSDDDTADDSYVVDSYRQNRYQSDGYTTALVILQDLPAEELLDSFDAVDEVVKRGDASYVIVDSDAAAASAGASELT
jgi:hypothetical protein